MQSSRLVFSLFAAVAVVCAGFEACQSAVEVRMAKAEIQRQALALAGRITGGGASSDVQALLDRIEERNLAGIAVFDARGNRLAVTSRLGPYIDRAPAAAVRALQTGQPVRESARVSGGPMQILAAPVRAGAETTGVIAIFQETAFLRDIPWRHFLAAVAQTVVIAGIASLLFHWSLRAPLRRMTQWLRDLRTGSASASTAADIPQGLLRPLASEASLLADSLRTARASAEEEARLRDAGSSLWTAERLRMAMRERLGGSRVFAVSNREPYEHVHIGKEIRWSVPPSGLVTALEPVLRASDGTWIAQGTGDADRATADEHGALRVPPDHPQYRLRRVWLPPEEQRGFYLGFANEGIWPLCHTAHTRPVFRTEDWNHYRAANARFTAVLLEEMSGEKDPVVLAQDYHFALLPRMVKKARPDSRVAIFWHIPWPNPDAFGICPWQAELLDGMLGADLVGFHIQAHCNNFLQTVERALEARIDRERFAVSRRDHITLVRPIPISVAFNGNGNVAAGGASAIRNAPWFRDCEDGRVFMGLGVDRIDYTKGIPERFHGIERLLERHPYYRQRLTFVQIGVPSRTDIRRYQDLVSEVETETERINRRFQAGSWKPIVFIKRHHDHEEIAAYYRQADFCLVTSLHDGMNLVAKEYIAARDDEQGALILSRFTGASQELGDALMVNPYHTDELAEAIHTALTMTPEEKRTRMQHMRATVKQNNVYRWAGRLVAELTGIRVETPGRSPGAQAE